MVRALVNHPNSSQTHLEYPEMTIIIMYETREVMLAWVRSKCPE